MTRSCVAPDPARAFWTRDPTQHLLVEFSAHALSIELYGRRLLFAAWGWVLFWAISAAWIEQIGMGGRCLCRIHKGEYRVVQSWRKNTGGDGRIATLSRRLQAGPISGVSICAWNLMFCSIVDEFVSISTMQKMCYAIVCGWDQSFKNTDQRAWRLLRHICKHYMKRGNKMQSWGTASFGTLQMKMTSQTAASVLSTCGRLNISYVGCIRTTCKDTQVSSTDFAINFHKFCLGYEMFNKLATQLTPAPQLKANQY